jgi:hypothetical protein
MRKLLLLAALIMVCSGFVWAINPNGPNPLTAPGSIQNVPPAAHRDAPAWDFITTPIGLITTYYDYSPGGYSALPMHVQQIAGYEGNVYLALTAKETTASTRRVYLVHFDAQGVPNTPTYISDHTWAEGFVGMDLDPVTGDPMCSWHSDWVYSGDSGDGVYDVLFGYDAFHTMPGPGMTSSSFPLFDHDVLFENGVIPYQDDEFIWPNTYVGPSPIDGKRRVYVVANNANADHDPSGNPAENILLAYTDFDTADIDAQTFVDMDWHFVTFPFLNLLNGEDPLWGRFFQTFACDLEGNVAIIGTYYPDEDGDDDWSNDGDSLMVYWNSNFGDGDWELTKAPGISRAIDNPIVDGAEVFDTSNPLYFDWSIAGHINAVFDNDGKLHFVASQSLNSLMEDGTTSYWPDYSFVKHAVYDHTTNTFEMSNLYPISTDSLNTYPLIPWDNDADGVIDTLDTGEVAGFTSDYPVYWWDPDDNFHENTFKMSQNKENHWMAAMWGNSTNARQFLQYNDEEYADWQEAPEQIICLSADNGKHWSEPISLNAIQTPELSGMIPEYMYPADLIEDLGNDHGKLHLFFLDDNSYGSYIQTNGSNLGGTLMYAAIDVDFSTLPHDAPEANTNQSAPSITSMNLKNYPNPFNPTTKIAFNLPIASNAKLNIYNVRGELVKTLFQGRMEAGEHSLYWNGVSDAGANVASGVYFARLSAGSHTATNKMLLLK